MTRKFMATFFILGLAAAAAAAEQRPPEEMHGVITQLQGVVEAAGPGTGVLPLASLWQVIQAGVTVRVPKGGSAGIVCSNHHFVRLRGPVSWSLTKGACSDGKELTPAEYALVAPQGGRFKVVEGLLVLEREIRSGDSDDPLAPVVLSPRNTVLRSPRPTVSWSRVSVATEYWLQWTESGTHIHDLRIEAGTAVCSQVLDGRPVCSLPWPEDRPDLPPGRTLFLKVAARSGIEEIWHFNGPVEVSTQEIAQAAALERQIHDLESLGLEGPALDAARGGFLAERGLYSDAADLFRRDLAATPATELRVTLADLEFAMGLHFLAESRYRVALGGEVSSGRAAAAFGLGRIAYTRGRYRDAAASFRQAGELYSLLRLGEEASAARQAAKEAEIRVTK